MIYVLASHHRAAVTHLKEMDLNPRSKNIQILTPTSGPSGIRGRLITQGDEVWVCRTLMREEPVVWETMWQAIRLCYDPDAVIPDRWLC